MSVTGSTALGLDEAQREIAQTGAPDDSGRCDRGGPEVSRSPTGPRGLREERLAYFAHEGHYKSAALVSEEFTRAATDGLLQIEEYRAVGYANMDAFVAVKPRA